MGSVLKSLHPNEQCTLYSTVYDPNKFMITFRGLLVYNSIAVSMGAPVIMDLWYLMFAKVCLMKHV